MSPASNPLRYESPFHNGYHTYGIKEVDDRRRSDDWWIGFVQGWVAVTGRRLWSGEDGTQPITITRENGEIRISVIAR